MRDAYVWDKNGNLTGLNDTRPFVLQTRTRSMAYDARDRLTSMTTAYNARTFSYTYDPLDNLRTTSASAGGRNLRHTYGTFGQLTRLFDPANPSLDVIAYTYDDRGNATSRTSATGFVPNTSSIVPDTANRVQSITTGGSIETFTYDGHGRRTRSTTTSGTLVHFYTQAGQLLLSENPATPTTITKSRQYHIYLGDRRVAQQKLDGRSYIHTDHLGSLLARTDTAGSLLEGTPIWEAWGAPVSGYSSVGGLRFAGHYTDRATGLSYMQQRYYDPYAGRFLAVDPVAANPGSFNRYWYANNNPYKYIDLDGRASCSKPTGSHICYESTRTESGTTVQPEPSANALAKDRQVQQAAKSGKLTDGTPLNTNEQTDSEQGIRVTTTGTYSNPFAKICWSCSDGDSGTGGRYNDSALEGDDSAGHTHPGLTNPLPGRGDAGLARDQGAYVVSRRGVFVIERTDVGYRVRQIAGDRLRGPEKAELIRQIDNWNTSGGASNSGVTTCSTHGC